MGGNQSMFLSPSVLQINVFKRGKEGGEEGRKEGRKKCPISPCRELNPTTFPLVGLQRPSANTSVAREHSPGWPTNWSCWQTWKLDSSLLIPEHANKERKKGAMSYQRTKLYCKQIGRVSHRVLSNPETEKNLSTLNAFSQRDTKYT